MLIQQTIFMTAFTLLKFTALYCSVGRPQSIFLATLRTSMLLFAIYALMNLVVGRKSFFVRIAFHEILALIVLSDLLYYKYFNVLPEIADLQFLKLLPAIWDSVDSLFSGVHLLLFADALLLTFHQYVMSRKEKASGPRMIYSILAAAILLGIICTDFSLGEIKSSGQAYEKFGLLHYHISQIPGILPANDNSGNRNISNTQPAEEYNEAVKAPRCFGIAKGRNIIVIQVESLQNLVINMYYGGQELTPNLNKLLAKDSIYFNRFYQQLGKGNTSDAEFVTQNSFYPSIDVPAYRKYENNRFMGFPMIMRENGYGTYAFHAYKPEFWNRQNMYPMLGYDRFINMNDFNLSETFGMGLSDRHFFEQSAEYLSTVKQPFYSFLVTLSSHHPFTLPENYKKIKLNPVHKDTLLGRYIQVINYTDEAIGLFIEKLKEYGLYENSIIAIYGDHRGISNGVPENDKLMAELLGHEYSFDESLNVPLIIHIPGAHMKETNTIAGGQMDFLPTMLNLLGIKESRLKLFGQDLLNAESGFVASQTSIIKGYFIDDEKIFVMSRDGVFENSKAWKLDTREPVDIELCRNGYERALRDIKKSEYILRNDLIQEFITLGETHTTFSNAIKAASNFIDRIAALFNRIIE
ncbi:MAG: LTA synthase family protein [Clostridiaceae bacterium]|nr:LTA synthase family protein [Clostridiaceae bacterium]